MNRRPFGKTVARGAALLLIGLTTLRVEADQPPAMWKLPGRRIGETESLWIAPFALATRYRIGQTRVSTVRWFDDKGRIVRELTGKLEQHSDYIEEYRGEGASFHSVYHDVNGRWKVDPPRKPGRDGFIAAAGDTFIHGYNPAEGEIAADIYRSGRLIGTVGPFVQYFDLSMPRLSRDGSIAFTTWKSPKKEAPQVVVVGPDAKVSFTAECSPDAVFCMPLDGGKGVIVLASGAGEHRTRYRCMRAGGEWMTLEDGAGRPTPAETPDGIGLLLCTYTGYRLVDTRTGKRIWEIPSPVRDLDRYVASIELFHDVFLFIAADLAAVDIKTGAVLGRWTPGIKLDKPARVARLGDRIFLVTPDEFTELDFTPADIAAKRNGWH